VRFLARPRPARATAARPVAAVVEAKINEVEAGLGQSAAQLVAARTFNAVAGRPAGPLFGCVTTGESWQILRFIKDAVALDRRRFYPDNAAGILAALLSIVREAERDMDTAN
jgi:hypothetical protein